MNDRRGGDEIEVGSITTPFFVHVKEKEMKANAGSTVLLNCRVRNTNNYTVYNCLFFILNIIMNIIYNSKTQMTAILKI